MILFFPERHEKDRKAGIIPFLILMRNHLIRSKL